MAYTENRSRSTIPSVTAVALVHVAIGYALLSGFAMTVIHQIDPVLTTYPVPADPPPPPPNPDPLPKATPETPTMGRPTIPVIELPRIALPELPPIELTPPPSGGSAAGTPALDPPAAPKASAAAGAQPLGDKLRWITGDDYPSASIRQGEEGVVVLRAEIGVDGRIGGCGIVRSSGYGALDAAACRIYQRRARFRPAKDAGGAPVASTVEEQILWRIPR